MKHYLKFALMMCCSFILMYTIMFMNVDQFNHIMLSATRTYMSLLMVAPMAIMMMLFMWKMYENRKLNVVIITGSIIVFSLSLYGLREQVPIKDVQYMKAMIPHHSSAIMVSQKATFEDPETAELAKQIIESQKKEIAQMKEIIERLEKEE